MAHTSSAKATAAGIAVGVTGLALGFYANMMAGIVQDAIRHPNVGSLAPLAIMAGLVLVGWLPAVTLGLWLSWRNQVLAMTGLNGPLPAVARQLDAGLAAW